MKHTCCAAFALLLSVWLRRSVCEADDVPVVCGGFIRSKFPADFTRVKVNLYTIDGTLKYSTDCAPNNGYFLLPLYDQGEYLVKAVPPQGWLITPNEVPLVVKETKDSCNSGKDIDFQLVGFTLDGQVTSGDNLHGPEGVEISLLPADNLDDSHIRHTYTVMEGRFKIEGVSPGIYKLTASHPLWKMSQDSVEVVVVDVPVTAPAGLKVLGYDVKGVVKSGGEPVEGVFLFLFAVQPLSNKDPIGCSSHVSPSPASPRPGHTPLCVVLSDSAGQFILYPLPPATYHVVPVYKQKELQFGIQPTELPFTVSNDSVILSQWFEVQGFSVRGQILLTREGPPVIGARVVLSNLHEATSDELGQYHLLNITTGSYTLKIEAQGMQFDPREVHISPASPSLQTISPNKYLVCGDVTEIIPVSQSIKLKERSVQVLSDGSNPVTTTTSVKGDFCVYLPLGEYRIKVVVSPEETEKGMLILPEEQFVAMLDTPATSRIVFTQFVANFSGSIRCIEKCPKDLVIKLIRSHKGKQEVSAQVNVNGLKAYFNFTSVLPGAVKVTLNDARWCWKTKEVSIVVVKGSQPPLTFHHVGYSMSYEVSHDTLIKYYEENGTANEVVLVGNGQLCLKKPGVYHIKPQSCHKFDKEHYIFDTSSPKHMVLHSTQHTLNIPVHTQVEDSSLSLVIRSTVDEKHLQPNKVEMIAKGSWAYSFDALVRSSDEIIIQPQSSVLMFSPPSLVWTVGQDCPETTTAFQGNPGELIEGRVEPPLANVTVVLDLGGDGQVTTYTDNSGQYRAGPVRGGDHITISVILDGYIFEPLGDLRSFRAIQLCHISVQVSSVHGEHLPRVLVSISGEDFRQNSFTDEDGSLFSSKLVPGQYFIKPFLREFDFTPSSLVLNLAEGDTKPTSFTGRRVAFSCSGVVSSLNRRPLTSVNVQGSGKGIGEECSSYSETAVTDAEGAYRLHGLMPGCQYNVSVKQDTSRALPSFRVLSIKESDVEKVDFLLMSQTKSVYISGWVDTDPKLVGTLKVGVFAEGKTEESPLYTVAVDTVGFFDFPPLPLFTKGGYLITLGSSLSTHSYEYSNTEELVSGTRDSHVLLHFTAEEILQEKDSQSRGSVIALILVIVIAFALVNFDKVLIWYRSYTHSTSEGFQRKTFRKK